MRRIDRAGRRLGKLRCDIAPSRHFTAFRRHVPDQRAHVGERDEIHYAGNHEALRERARPVRAGQWLLLRDPNELNVARRGGHSGRPATGPFVDPSPRSEKQDQPDKLDRRIENIRRQGDDPSGANQPDHDGKRYRRKWLRDCLRFSEAAASGESLISLRLTSINVS